MSDDDQNTQSLQDGARIIREFAKSLPNAPGVYRMLDAKGDALYIGKARSLPKRVITYASPGKLGYRLQRMVAQTARMEFTTTHTEAEALLLESNLIKKLKPRYNILLRDDKSFPYILLTSDHDFPQVTKHRGSRGKDGEYFGPFASTGAVNKSIATLQKAFMLRNCSDNVFASRTRPCLQYQIRRCTAPCVGHVDKDEYAEQVQMARDFLQGKSREIQEKLLAEMQAASEALEFEKAAQLRDRIRALTSVQNQQNIHAPGLADADVISLYREGEASCIQVFFFRAGQNYGNRAYFPRHKKDEEDGDILSAFIGQFYSNKPVPPLLLVSISVPHKSLVEDALSLKAERRVKIHKPDRGAKKQLIELAMANAKEALARRFASNAAQEKLLAALAETIGLDAPPERIEVYDNSHTGGRNQVGAMIVATPEGCAKNAYRKFNISADTRAGDDYGMMREVLRRRFSRTLKEDPDRESANWPDLVIIDGGKGQLSSAQEVMDDLGLDDIPLLAIAKGPDRNAGRETMHMKERPVFSLESGDPVLYMLQRLRDEAHRFAIGSHRARRKKDTVKSPLDGIDGIGPVRKKALLHHFGSARAVSEAGLADLENVEGISRAVAKKIYDHFHDGE